MVEFFYSLFYIIKWSLIVAGSLFGLFIVLFIFFIIKIGKEPILKKIVIEPNNPRIGINSNIQLIAKGYDENDNFIGDQKVNWDAEKGNISDNGIFTAGNQEERVKITATLGEVTTEIYINIFKPISYMDIIKPRENISIQSPSFVSETSKLTKLKIEPQSITLSPNSSYQFKVTGLDQRGRKIEINNVMWETTLGVINEKTGFIFIQGNHQGYGNITAKVDNITANAKIHVKNTTAKAKIYAENPKIQTKLDIKPILKTIEITPKEIELYPEQEYQFTVKGYDQNNNLIDVNKIKWQSQFGGRINSEGLFTGGYHKKNVIITASVDKLKATANITILPILRKLKISPSFIALKPEETQQFLITGIDQFKQEIDTGAVTWYTDGGVIDQQGFFTASLNQKGNFKVIAISETSPKFNATTRSILSTVGFSSRILAWLISPQTQLKDVFKNHLWESFIEQLLSYETPVLEGSKSEDNYLLETNIDNQELMVIDHDQSSGLMIPDEIANWLTEGIKTKTSRLFASFANFCLDQATSNVNISANVNILPILKSIKINPSSAEIMTGQKVKFAVIGLDQVNEEYYIEEPIEWYTNNGNINNDGILSINTNSDSEKEKTITVTVKVVNFEDSAQVKVVQRKLTSLIISPKEITLNPDDTQQFTVKGLDQLGNQIETGKIIWSAKGGNIDKNGYFTAAHDLKGSYQIIAKSQKLDINKTAKINILPVLRRLEIKPENIQINIGDICYFSVKGLDQKEQLMIIDKVIWETTEGDIDSKGRFLADNIPEDVTEVMINATVNNNLNISTIISICHDENTPPILIKYCGDITSTNIGEDVIIYGWINSYYQDNSLIVIELEDKTGIIQIITNINQYTDKIDNLISLEKVVKIVGKVNYLQQHYLNVDLSYKDIEIIAESVQIFDGWYKFKNSLR